MKLHINEHPIDRVVRIVLGVGLFAFVVTSSVAALWLCVVAFVGAVLIATGIVGFCPLYRILGVSTLRPRQ